MKHFYHAEPAFTIGEIIDGILEAACIYVVCYLLAWMCVDGLMVITGGL